MAISVSQYTTVSSTDISSLLQGLSSGAKADTSGDTVSISQEAQELVHELNARKNKTFVTTEQEASFVRVANALPNSEGFNDMLDWLRVWSSGENRSISIDSKAAIDRNAYMRDPKKYAQLWKNLYDNYNETMKEFGLNPQFDAHREALKDSVVLRKVQMRFSARLDKNTQNLMKFFNIYES